MSEYFEGDPRTNRARMNAGDYYIADEPLHRDYMAALSATHEYERLYVARNPLARFTLANLLGTLGEGVEIRPPFKVDYGFNLHVGAGTFINFGLTALDPAPIRIGENCQIATNVQLLTPLHPLEPTPRRDGLEKALPITIGNNVWLGGGVIVCPGVSIGDNSVIGAGAVVTKDVPPNVVAVGNPARIVRSIAEGTLA